MTSQIATLVLLCFIAANTVVNAYLNYHSHSGWNYGSRGPSTWPGFCRSGKRQSPVNFDVTTAVVDSSIPLLKFTNYDGLLHNLTVINNGHSCQINMPHGAPISLSGGNLASSYDLLQIHFHWGAITNPSLGSEHTLNQLHYPLEAHFVHKKHNVPIEECLKQSDGLAVIAVFFRLLPGNNSIPHTPLQGIERVLKDIRYAGNETTLSRLAPNELLPDNRGQFFRYDGSLTTPGCNESVVWSVMLKPLDVTEKQLAALGELTDGDGEPLMNNFRPTQPINGRTVRLRRPANLQAKAGTTQQLGLLAVATALALHSLMHP